MSDKKRWGWGTDAPGDAGGAALPDSGQAQDSILQEIVARTRADLVDTKRAVPLERLKQMVATRRPTRDFAQALRPGPDGRPRIIAELKRASPSKGMIRPDFGVMTLSGELVAHGAAALSVLTEVHYFMGNPRYLQAVAAAVDVPVLRKDFIVDEYQLYEARAWGADAVLLIAAVLDRLEFQQLYHLARELDLAVLAEVRSREELQTVLAAGAEVVGINSRDLRTFKTDLATVEALAGELPPGVIAVAESGITGPADIARLGRVGVHAFLVGELLMRAPAPGQALDALLGAARPALGAA